MKESKSKIYDVSVHGSSAIIRYGAEPCRCWLPHGRPRVL